MMQSKQVLLLVKLAAAINFLLGSFSTASGRVKTQTLKIAVK